MKPYLILLALSILSIAAMAEIAALGDNHFLLSGALPEAVRYKVKIETARGGIVREYERTGRHYEVVYNGTDSFGKPLKKGTFDCYIEYVPASGTAQREKIGTIAIAPPETENILAYIEHPLVKIRRHADTRDASGWAGAPQLRIKAAANEYISFQVVLAARQSPFSVTALRLPPLRNERGDQLALGLSIYAEHYLQVNKPTWPMHDYQERYSHDRGIFDAMELEVPHRYYPDALIPLKLPLAIMPPAAENITPLWCDAVIPKGTKPGIYRGSLEVDTDARTFTFPVEVEVFAFELGDTALPSLFPLRTREGTEAERDEHFQFLLSRRMVGSLPRELTAPGMEKIANDPRVPCFHPFERTNKIEALAPIIEAGKRGGWLDKLYIYTYDEPSREELPHLLEFSSQLKKLAPGVPLLITFCVGDPYPQSLIGAIGIWCPHYSLTGKDFPAAQKGGKRWWYINPLLLLDYPAGAPRAALWKQANYGIEGLLLWDAHCYSRFPDPYNDADNSWGEGVGNGLIVYPGAPVGVDGLVSSIRLETLRDAIEDYFYLARLEQLTIELARRRGATPAEAAAQGRAAVEAFSAAMIEPLEITVIGIESNREKLARAIEQLQSQLTSE